MIGDTIYAIASPPGAAARGLIRVSGPAAFAAAGEVLAAVPARVRGAAEVVVQVLGFPVPCLLLAMPGPGSYTGEDTVELHLPGSPVLLDEVCRRLEGPARLATPGEFTRRAFENGRLDLAEAEAVLQLIHAADLSESRFAVDVLRGGLAQAVEAMRRDLLDARALLEAGLDFTVEETGAVQPDHWLPQVRAAAGRCVALRESLPRTGVQGEILLLGATNAGKSSLVNALAGAERSLVGAAPGTTRDVLAVEVAPGVRLLDAPGDLPDLPAGAAHAGAARAGAARAGDPRIAAADRAAIGLRDRLAERARGVLEVVDLTRPRFPGGGHPLPVVARVFTKADLQPVAPRREDGVRCFVVSSVTGVGLPALAEFLHGAAGSGPRGLSTRLHQVLLSVEAALARVESGAALGEPEELLALDLGEAVGELDRICGRSTPEDLLDRIFAGFCLGK